MSLQIECSCGKKLRAPETMAGKRAKCPQCGEIVQIPAQEQAPLDDLFADLDDQSAAGSAPLGAPLGAAPLQTRSATNPWPLRMAIGAGVLVGVVVLVLIVSSLFSGSERLAEGSATPAGDTSVPLDGGKADGEKDAPSAQEASPTTRPSDPGPSESQPVSSTQGDSPANDGIATLGPLPEIEIPSAIIERPEWLTDGPYPPFDIDEFFHTPPKEENAAYRYIRLFYDIDPEQAQQNYGGQSFQTILSNPLPMSRAMQDLYRQLSAWRHNPAASEQPTNEQLQQIATVYEPIVLEIYQLQQLPSCVFYYDMDFGGIIYHGLLMRQTAKVLDIAVETAVREGDFAAAIQAWEAMLIVSRNASRRGETLVRMVCNAIEAMALGGGQPGALDSILGMELTPQQFDQLLKVVQRHREAKQDAAMEAYKTEYVLARSVFQNVRQQKFAGFMREGGLTTLEQSKLPNPGPESPSGYLTAVCLTSGRGQDAWQASAIHQAFATTPKANWESVFPKIDEQIRSMEDSDYFTEIRALNLGYKQVMELAGQSHLQRLEALKSVGKGMKYSRFAVLLSPISDADYYQANFMNPEALSSAVQCRLAVLRWQQKHDRLPDSLENAVLEAGLQGIPLDPYSGKAMRVKLTEPPIYYSVGPDGVDDGGKPMDRETQQGDFILREG